MTRLLRQCQRQLQKRWIRGFRGGTRQPSVRAILLGDFVSEIIVLDDEFEGAQLAALEKGIFCELDEGTCLDIGAHIGNHSVRFAKHFKRVVAFEPHPLTAHLLRANSFGKAIEVVEMGLSSEAGRLTIPNDIVNLGHARIVRNSEGIEIRVASLDQVAEGLGLEDVRFIKIDVEGHEARVLEGGRTTLARHLPVLAIEMHGHICQKLNEEVEILLREIG